MAKKQFNLKIEEELLEKIREVSASEFRSVNSQIEFILNKYIEEQEQQSNPKP